MRKLAAVAFLLTSVAAVVACSGGGNAVPSGAGIEQNPGRHRTVRAALILRIPSRRHRRRGHYISPGTASLAITVFPVGSSGPSPTPMPREVFNVATPLPCATIAGSGGALQCTFNVRAVEGRDAFSIATYPSPKAQGTPLSAVVSGVENIPTPSPSGVTALQFTLEGAVASVNVVFTSSANNIQAIPIGTATTTPFNVLPFDASGFEILQATPAPSQTETPFFNAIKLTVLPADGAVNVLKKGSASGTTSVSLTKPSELSNLTMSYDGSVRFVGSTLSEQYTIGSSVGSITVPSTVEAMHRHPAGATPSPTPPPQTGTVNLASNAIAVSIPVPPTVSSPYPIGMVPDSTGAKLFPIYGSYANSNISALGSANTSTLATSAQQLAYYVNDITYDGTNNAIWTADGTAVGGLLHCYTPSLTEVGSPAFTPASPAPTGYVAWSNNGTIWYAQYDSPSQLEYVGALPVTGQCAPGAPPTTHAMPPSPIYPVSALVASSSSTAVLGTQEVYISSAYMSGAAIGFNATGPTTTTTVATPDPTGIYAITSMREASPGSTNVYFMGWEWSCSLSPCSQSYLGLLSGGSSPAATSIGVVPDNGYPTGGMWVHGNTVAFAERTYAAMGVANATTGAMQLLPLPCTETTKYPSYAASTTELSGIAFDANGTPWANCASQQIGASNVTPQVVRVVLTHTWNLFVNPSTFQCNYEGIVGIGGAQPSDSFSVTGTGAFAGAALSGNSVTVTPSCSGSGATAGTIEVSETNSNRALSLSLVAYPAGGGAHPRPSSHAKLPSRPGHGS